MVAILDLYSSPFETLQLDCFSYVQMLLFKPSFVWKKKGFNTFLLLKTVNFALFSHFKQKVGLKVTVL